MSGNFFKCRYLKYQLNIKKQTNMCLYNLGEQKRSKFSIRHTSEGVLQRRGFRTNHLGYDSRCSEQLWNFSDRQNSMLEESICFIPKYGWHGLEPNGGLKNNNKLPHPLLQCSAIKPSAQSISAETKTSRHNTYCA